jgi:hypothetical protein
MVPPVEAEEAMTTARRGFLKSLALAPLAPSALAPQAAPPPTTPPLAGDAAVAGALAEAVRREFGAQLDDAELDAVKKELTRNLESAKRLRQAAKLVNADEPVTRFDARPSAAAEKGSRR